MVINAHILILVKVAFVRGLLLLFVLHQINVIFPEFVILLLEFVRILPDLMVLVVMMEMFVHKQISVRLDLVLVVTPKYVLPKINVMFLEYVILLLEFVQIPTQLMELVVMMEMHAHKQISARLDLVLVAPDLMVLFVMMGIHVHKQISVRLDLVLVVAPKYVLPKINVMFLEYVILLMDLVQIPKQMMELVVMMQMHAHK